jgi:hypothetical protein
VTGDAVRAAVTTHPGAPKPEECNALDDAAQYICEESEVSYTVVSPKADETKPFQVTWQNEVRPFDLDAAREHREHAVRFEVMRSGKYERVPLVWRARENGEIIWALNDETDLTKVSFTNGAAVVRFRARTYKSRGIEPFIISTMSLPTHRAVATVRLVGFEPEKAVKCTVFGLDRVDEEAKRETIGSALRMEYTGWLLEDHGYFFWW